MPRYARAGVRLFASVGRPPQRRWPPCRLPAAREVTPCGGDAASRLVTAGQSPSGYFLVLPRCLEYLVGLSLKDPPFMPLYERAGVRAELSASIGSASVWRNSVS